MFMQRFAVTVILVALAAAAFGQSNPGLITGQVPTAAQWNSYFAAKQDVIGYTAVSKSGDTMLGRLATAGAAPALTSCGTSPSISGDDEMGEVTMGTGTPTGCVITFATAFASAPKCVVTWQANLASMGYTTTTTALTLTQTATSSNVVDYYCRKATSQ